MSFSVRNKTRIATITASIEQCTGGPSQHGRQKKDINVKEETDGQ